MGWKSTLEITREDALSEIMRHILKSDDEQIADILETLVGDKLGYNFTIIHEYDEDRDWPNYKDRGSFEL